MHYTVTWRDWINFQRTPVPMRLPQRTLKQARQSVTNISARPYVTDVKILRDGKEFETYYQGVKQTPLFGTKGAA